VINTARLVLRPLTMNDLDADIERQWHERGHGPCAVELRDARGFIGRCGLNYWAQFDEIEAGWILKPDAWGHGYATEATRACIEWGFARLDDDYFTAMIDPANAASIRVAESLGFSPRRDDEFLGKKVTVYAVDRPA
jgi:RimJ/RimL family protein N-acetyltransferase